MTGISWTRGFLFVMLTLGLTPLSGAWAGEPNVDAVIYPTYGVHNPDRDSPCTYPTCVYKRTKGEPQDDPKFPPYWSSRWTMYRVFKNYETYGPPYDGKPPAALKEGEDYQTSYGATYYDSTWTGGARKGAMMEHYEKFCLPIFPLPNNYTCSFISLGNTAFFVTYDADRPAGMPKVCLFSDMNHPPAMDFIKHLPYAKVDSDKIMGKDGKPAIQGYSFWIDPAQNGKPVQVGVIPDQTAKQWIMFGYAFEAQPTPDAVDKTVAPYRHPQSFYFSGVPVAPPDAPMVSQNYTDFAMARPDPAKTWDQVAGLDPTTLERCQLFEPPGHKGLLTATGKKIPTWADLVPSKH